MEGAGDADTGVGGEWRFAEGIIETSLFGILF